MGSEKQQEFSLNFTESSFSKIDFNFRPIKIRVYKNGDNYDEGKIIAVTRREFKHWVIFLDGLTEKLETATAVHRLYTLKGIRVDHFDELENNGEYVAVERGPFVDCSYGKCREIEPADRKWTSLVRILDSKPTYLNSGDSMDIYLRKEGYGSYTGLPYPFDGVIVKSPSAFHMSGLSKKLSGSTEQLKKIEPNSDPDPEPDLNVSLKKRGEEKNVAAESTVNVTKLPKLVGLDDEKGQKNKTPTPTVNHSKPPQSKKLSIVQPKYDRYAPIVKGEQPKESRIPIKLEQIQQEERQVQSQDYSDMSENVQFEFTY